MEDVDADEDKRDQEDGDDNRQDREDHRRRAALARRLGRPGRLAARHRYTHTHTHTQHTHRGVKQRPTETYIQGGSKK